MSLRNWVRFSWDLTALPASAAELPPHYQIAPATQKDEMGLRKVFSSSFLLDPVWNPAIGDVMQTIQSRLDRLFAAEAGTCLALRHGSRIIGAAVVSDDLDSEDHFAPGPCILVEYRNRGFGTRLLEGSLFWLREAGLVRAFGMALDYAPVAKFLYPKFGGSIVRSANASLLAA
jgi:GNAT superfamily N-acetyltransferase